MKPETSIIIRHKLLKSAKDVCSSQSEAQNQANRQTYILGARHLLFLLSQHKILDFEAIDPLLDELDLNKIKV